MSTAEAAPDAVEEWVLEEVEHRVKPQPDGLQDAESNVWTSKERLRDDGRKYSTKYSRDEIEAAVDELLERNEILSWHGLLAPATKPHLRAVVENEREAGIQRTVLIGRCNQLLQEAH